MYNNISFYEYKIGDRFFDELIDNFKDNEFVDFPSLITDPKIYEKAFYEGILPMTSEHYFIKEGKYYSYYTTLFKLHFERAIIFLKDFQHIGKTVRNKSAKYYITFDNDYERVCENIEEKFFGINWLIRDYTQVLKKLRYPNSTLATVHTVELWNENDELVAGDFGVTVGARYLSLSGFYNENNSGTVLLQTLGALLKMMDFEIWDMGMYVEYKEKLGITLLERDIYLDIFHKTQDNKKDFDLSKIFNSEKVNCRDVIKKFL